MNNKKHTITDKTYIKDEILVCKIAFRCTIIIKKKIKKHRFVSYVKVFLQMRRILAPK